MSDNSFNNTIGPLLQGLESFLSTKTVVGEPTQIGDTTIIPLVDVSFGAGVGASLQDKKNGGAGGITGKMSPNAVLLIQNGQTKVVNIKNQDTMTKILDMVPDIIDRFKGPKAEMPSDDVVKDAAFPEE